MDSEISAVNVLKYIASIKKYSYKDDDDDDDATIKTLEEVISFCGKIDTTKQTVEEKNIQKTVLRKRRAFILSAVLNLETKRRILGWNALFTVIKHIFDHANQKNRHLDFLLECRDFLEHLMPEIDEVQSGNEKDQNLTLFCLTLLEYYKNNWGDVRLEHLPDIFGDIFRICYRIAFTHSSATLTVFKCLAIIMEISVQCELCEGDSLCYGVGYTRDLLRIFMSNWENPVAAVRKLVKELLKQWLYDSGECERSIELWPNRGHPCQPYRLNCKLRLYENIMMYVTWTHSFEYHILAAILQSLKSVPEIICEPDNLSGRSIKNGLTWSLTNHDLAPAGAELYRTLLNMLSEPKWTLMFDSFIIQHLKGENRMIITNIFKYWMPATFKKYPTYTPLEVNSFENTGVVSNLSLDFLSVIKMLKMKRKRGYMAEPKGNDRFVERCLSCSDEDVRCDAFGYVCESSAEVQPWEYEAVKLFLEQNVNYDRSNLRQSMVNYCISFFLRIRGSVIARLASKSNIQSALYFIDDLHYFLTSNLSESGNYQRKITSLMLYNAILTYFGIGGSKEKDQRKSNTKDKSGIVEEKATSMGKWKYRSKESRKLLISCINDISESVRSAAADLLMHHFKFDKDDQAELNELYNLGKKMCSSPCFHKAESGALLISTITILAFKSDYSLIENMLKNSNPIVFGGSQIPSVTLDLIELAKQQSAVLFKDTFMAAVHGSPLHGVLRALMLLLSDGTRFEFSDIIEKISSKDAKDIFKSSNNSTGTFCVFSVKLANHYSKKQQEGKCDLLEDIITLLEKDVSEMLALLSFSKDNSSKGTSCPSFAVMGESLEEIVKQSEVSCSNDEVLMIPVSYQLVLNCIWSNLKICCIFASNFVKYGLANCNKGSCSRCFTILETVLNKCRHKGAMDVAGSAMFSATKALKEKADKFSAEERKIPSQILDRFFKNMSSPASSSLSRRSAGRAFLVHSVVAQPNSPLLGKTLSRLIEIIREDVQNNEDSLVDLPQVSALHILSTLVQDSRFNILPYAKEIFCVCFDKLSLPVYTVKNAALQLFRALLMRLMRRMKGECQDNTESTSDLQTTPLEELYFHIPKLFSFVESKLAALSSTSDINSHAKLIPILVFLSNLSTTFYTFYSQSDGYARFVGNIRMLVQQLFSSPVHFVRELSARIDANLMLPPSSTSTNIRIQQACLDDTLDQNLLHGLVMNLKYLSHRLLHFKFAEEIQSKWLFEISPEASFKEEIVNCLTMLIKFPNVSHYLKSIAADLILLWNPAMTLKPRRGYNLESVKKSVANYKSHLGSALWLRQIIGNICVRDLSLNLTKFCLLESNNVNVALACLEANDLISLDKGEKVPLIQAIIKTRHEPEIIERLLTSLEHVIHNEIEIMNCIFTVVVKNSKFGDRCKYFGIHVVCSILNFHYTYHQESFLSEHGDISIEVLECLSEWSRPSTVNEDLRIAAAECMDYFRGFMCHTFPTNIIQEEYVFDRKSDRICALLWLASFNLLQDEVLEIRLRACCCFLGYFSHPKLDVPSPFLALQRLTKVTFMANMMSLLTALGQLWAVVCTPLDGFNVGRSVDLLNPFDHGIDNFYKEDSRVTEMILEEFEVVAEESTLCRIYLERLYFELKAVVEVEGNSAQYPENSELNYRLKEIEEILSRNNGNFHNT